MLLQNPFESMRNIIEFESHQVKDKEKMCECNQTLCTQGKDHIH